MAPTDDRLTVAVTGPTGTFGFGLVPLLEAHPQVGTIVGIARRPFDPAAQGWTGMTYRQGDVRDPEALRDAFEGADVVVHLAFLITGTTSRHDVRSVNIDGTRNAYRAAAAVGARRFVYASSVAAYGFHDDNPVGMTEDWPTRPAAHLFYAQEKAELEGLLRQEAARRPGPDLYLLRPPIVLGPHAVGAKELLPGLLDPIARLVGRGITALPPGVPVPLPDLPMQFVHEDDVGQALLACVLGDGPPGAYNLAGDGVVGLHDVARELGLRPVPLPVGLAQQLARGLAAVPVPSFVPPVTEWVEAAARPAIVDTTRAKLVLGWQPRYTGLEALRDTIGRR